ncbi:MAG: cytochrome c [Methylacidiphilales bacterium]|nr:cytochrome c [Candidatus Methylacidiphilales bacterium]MDW8349692.1 cytochrome c [Verrucomicrobiae bacterium]
MSTAPTPPPNDPQNETPESLEAQTRALEYNEDTDVEKIHAAILREKQEPQDGLEPLPLWLVLLFSIIIFWGGGYLFFYSGGFKHDVYDEKLITWGPVTATATQKTIDPIAIGKRLYTANCAACHQATGLGLAGQYPPLADSEYVLGRDGWGTNHLIKLVLNGLEGPITVKGQPYNGNMPAQKDILKDEQIAHILTYIRQEWGNNAPPITPQQVAAIRAEVGNRRAPWTLNELRAIPASDVPTP